MLLINVIGKRLAFLLWHCLLSVLSLSAQQMPISVTTVLTQPYAATLSQMCQSVSTKLMANIYVSDVTITEIPVRVHVKLESHGISIESQKNAIQSPIYTAQTSGTMHSLQPATLALEYRQKYCWRVTASDPTDQATMQENGCSEVRTFQYLEKCPPVCDLSITQNDVYADISWGNDQRHENGWNMELYDDAGTSHKTYWYATNQKNRKWFDYGTTWHVRVQGITKPPIA